MQTLPGFYLVTSAGLDALDYEGIAVAGSTAKAQPAHQSALNAAWDDVLSRALSAMHSGLKALAMAGAEPPDVGLELADEKGKVVAESEVCWAAAQLVVLRDDQSDMIDVWANQGWTVLLLDEPHEKINGKKWAEAVAEYLKLSLPNQE
jgi:DEAD/DEAH box helicase domain-containing protein